MTKSAAKLTTKHPLSHVKRAAVKGGLLAVLLISASAGGVVSCSAAPPQPPAGQAKTSQKTTPQPNTYQQTNPRPAGPAHTAGRQQGLKNQTLVSFNRERWHSLKYRNIPANTVHFNGDKITIQVHHSASPLIYPLTNILKITGVEIKGQVDRLVRIQENKKQGQKGWDDFPLRLGLVLIGNKRLNWFEKKISPEWVIKLHNLAPYPQGISRIYFLNAVQSPSQLNHHRTHPLSHYIEEHYVWLLNKAGPFAYSHRFNQPQHTTALWISADGDDTQSTFTLEINQISLNR